MSHLTANYIDEDKKKNMARQVAIDFERTRLRTNTISSRTESSNNSPSNSRRNTIDSPPNSTNQNINVADILKSSSALAEQPNGLNLPNNPDTNGIRSISDRIASLLAEPKTRDNLWEAIKNYVYHLKYFDIFEYFMKRVQSHCNNWWNKNKFNPLNYLSLVISIIIELTIFVVVAIARLPFKVIQVFAKGLGYIFNWIDSCCNGGTNEAVQLIGDRVNEIYNNNHEL